MNYHELEKLTAVRLRELAAEDPDLKGVSGMDKAQLVDLLAHRYGLEKPHKVAVGSDKSAIKVRIRELKEMRERAISEGDRHMMDWTRNELHKLRHKLRKQARVSL